MKKLFLITIILLLQSFPSFGKWKKVLSTSYGVYFINSDTIMKNEDLIYYDTLLNYFEPNIKSSLSQIDRTVMNCKTKKYRGVRFVSYFEPMGKGKVVYEYNFIGKSMVDVKNEEMNLFYDLLCK